MELQVTPNLLSCTPQEAVEMQKRLRGQVLLMPYTGPLELIGGADVSFNKYSPQVYAAFVVLEAATMKVIASSSAVMEVSFPYIPGLLSFREIPPLLEAWKKLQTRPDVIVFDGQGIAHPRRLGIASHAGLILDVPSIGCAKSILTGVHEKLPETAGARTPLLDRYSREKIGDVLRTKKGVRPVYISPGHRMDFASSLRIIESCVRKYRIPEPTRQAHVFVNEVRKARQSGLFE